MKYISTRGDPKELSFEETVLTGLAPDGGLYIPTSIPSLPTNWDTEWADLSFVDLALEVLSLYISLSEISREDLRALLEASYKTFRHPDVSPLKHLDDDTIILELFHGPTFAFKDVALQFLGNLFEYFLKRRNGNKEGQERERLTIVGATSGDTGSAAIYGLRNKADLSIFILHPKGRVSPIQEAQMTTVTDSNVFNLAVKGTFDDCQDIVKALFADTSFNTSSNRLGAVNSINWARILAQIVYYFKAYFQLSSEKRKAIQFVVPTGNFGDVLAGYYAKRMGLPMGKLAIATNENDILARFWKSGVYEKVDSSFGSSRSNGSAIAPANGASDGKQADAGVKETLSPAMDILVSSNFERLLWYLAFEACGKDIAEAGRTVKGWMASVKSDGKCQVPTKVLEAARRDFVAEKQTDAMTLETIHKTWQEFKYVVDPHTAVGLGAARVIASANPTGTVQIALSTAHPAKFSEAVTKVLNADPQFDFEKVVLPKEFIGLLERERKVIDVQSADVEAVKKVIVDATV